jgi:hypothetical protein
VRTRTPCRRPPLLRCAVPDALCRCCHSAPQHAPLFTRCTKVPMPTRAHQAQNAMGLPPLLTISFRPNDALTELRRSSGAQSGQQSPLVWC